MYYIVGIVDIDKGFVLLANRSFDSYNEATEFLDGIPEWAVFEAFVVRKM